MYSTDSHVSDCGSRHRYPAALILSHCVDVAGSNRERTGRCIANLVLDHAAPQQAPQAPAPDSSGQVQRHMWLYTFVRRAQAEDTVLPERAQCHSSSSTLPNQTQAQAQASLPNQARTLPADTTMLGQAPTQTQAMHESGFAEGDMLVLSIEGRSTLLLRAPTLFG